MRLRLFTSRFLPEIALAVFCLANLVWIALAPWEALPVHFIFVSVSVVYGLRMWTTATSALALVAVSLPIFLSTLHAVSVGAESPAEIAEIPLMSLIFFVMVWHVRIRQSAVDRGRALFDNASHELLTPLTIARGELELLGRDGQVPTLEELTETRRVVLEELQRSEVLAAGLLTLSRLDSAHPTQRTLVPADGLLDAAVTRWARVADRPVTVTARTGGELLCAQSDVERLLDNLIENALRHAPEGTQVALATHARGTEPRARGERRGQRDSAQRAPLSLRPLLPRTLLRRHARQRSRPGDRQGDRGSSRGQRQRAELARCRNDVQRRAPGLRA